MRYLIAGAFLFLSQTSVADVDLMCQTNCSMKGYSYAYCQQACSYGPQGAGNSGGFAGGYMRGKEFQAQQEQAAAQTRLLEEQTRALQLENQRRQAELRQARDAAAATSTVPQEPRVTRDQAFEDCMAKGVGADTCVMLQAAGVPPKPSGGVGAVGSVTPAQWQAAVAPRKGRYPDFDAVVFARDVSMSPDMIQCMARSPYAADIAYYLGKHKDQAAKIAGMNLLGAAVAINEIEGKVAAPGR